MAPITPAKCPSLWRDRNAAVPRGGVAKERALEKETWAQLTGGCPVPACLEKVGRRLEAIGVERHRNSRQAAKARRVEDPLLSDIDDGPATIRSCSVHSAAKFHLSLRDNAAIIRIIDSHVDVVLRRSSSDSTSLSRLMDPQSQAREDCRLDQTMPAPCPNPPNPPRMLLNRCFWNQATACPAVENHVLLALSSQSSHEHPPHSLSGQDSDHAN